MRPIGYTQQSFSRWPRRQVPASAHRLYIVMLSQIFKLSFGRGKFYKYQTPIDQKITIERVIINLFCNYPVCSFTGLRLFSNGGLWGKCCREHFFLSGPLSCGSNLIWKWLDILPDPYPSYMLTLYL